MGWQHLVSGEEDEQGVGICGALVHVHCIQKLRGHVERPAVAGHLARSLYNTLLCTHTLTGTKMYT